MSDYSSFIPAAPKKNTPIVPAKTKLSIPQVSIPSVAEYSKNDPLVDKLRKWLLIGLTTLVGGGAIILIVINLFRRYVL